LVAAAEGFARWIDSVAVSAATLLDRFSSPRVVALIEQSDKEFVVRADDGSIGERMRLLDGHGEATSATAINALSGSRIELILQPDRYLIQPLELPSRATEFLDGVVRNQIDQLTPWSAADAAFGWSKPTECGADRISMTVAATALEWVSPYVQA